MPGYEEQMEKRPFNLKVWGKLLPFLKPYKKPLIITITMNLFTALIDILLPLFQRYAIDNFIEEKALDGLWGYAALYAGVILVQTFSVVMFCRKSMEVEMNVGKDLKRASFVHLQTLSFSYYNVTPVGYLLARVMSDTNRIAGLVAWGLVDILWALAYVAGVFVAMLMLNVRLALLVILVVPALAVLTVYFQNKILHCNRRIRKVNSQMTGAYNEGITGAKTSKTLVIEQSNFEDFSRITQDMRASSIKAARLNAIYIPTVLFVSSIATAVVLAMGGNLVMEHVMMLRSEEHTSELQSHAY